MNNTASWMKEAEEQAKKYSDSIKQSNQYLIEQLAQSKNNTLNQLQAQQDNSIYNLNTNQSTINKTADDNAKQLYVNKLLALKSNQEAMNRTGLGTQGVVGSQVNSINNAYGNNLTSVLNQKTNDLRNLEKEKNNSLLTYNTNRLNLENEYGNNIANLQSQIDDKALNQYNNVYSNVLNMKQQDYENQQAEIARQEAIRQYNENLSLEKAKQEEAIRQYNSNLEYQKQQDALANAQKWASIQAQQTSTKQQSNPLAQFEETNTKFNDIDAKVGGAIKSGFSSNVKKALAQSIITTEMKNGNITQQEAIKLAEKYGL